MEEDASQADMAGPASNEVAPVEAPTSVEAPAEEASVESDPATGPSAVIQEDGSVADPSDVAFIIRDKKPNPVSTQAQSGSTAARFKSWSDDIKDRVGHWLKQPSHKGLVGAVLIGTLLLGPAGGLIVVAFASRRRINAAFEEKSTEVREKIGEGLEAFRGSIRTGLVSLRELVEKRNETRSAPAEVPATAMESSVPMADRQDQEMSAAPDTAPVIAVDEAAPVRPRKLSRG